MGTKKYIIPEQILDNREKKTLVTLTEAYNKMIEPSAVSKVLSKVGQKIPQPIKDFTNATKEKITDNELFVKSLEVLGKSFQVLEQLAVKVTLSEKEIIKAVNPIVADNEITSIDEICLARGYDISKLVGKAKLVDIIATLIEGATTGYAVQMRMPYMTKLRKFTVLLSIFRHGKTRRKCCCKKFAYDNEKSLFFLLKNGCACGIINHL